MSLFEEKNILPPNVGYIPHSAFAPPYRLCLLREKNSLKDGEEGKFGIINVKQYIHHKIKEQVKSGYCGWIQIFFPIKLFSIFNIKDISLNKGRFFLHFTTILCFKLYDERRSHPCFS